MGIEPNSQQTLTMNGCDSGTKSSLGLNCYFTAVYISTKTYTSGCSASVTDAMSYHTCIYSYFEYPDTAPPIVLLALRQRYETRQETSQRVVLFWTVDQVFERVTHFVSSHLPPTGVHSEVTTHRSWFEVCMRGRHKAILSCTSCVRLRAVG